ncbi:heparin lyase I family protein [Streptomyces sp. NPDC014733]|uniref:heparin lyase I family protein n=1 Tax=Streptomyces sp. NPDC014733 TaxID=3364885 RepID=UPI0036F8713C
MAVGILAVSAATFLVWPASAGSAANGASQAAPAKVAGEGRGPAAALPSAKAGRVLWTPKITAGRGAFPSVQCATGGFRVVRDPVKGKVWRAHQPGGQERCEAVGPTLKSGSTFYLGWSSKVDIRDSKNRYIFQLKCSPSTGTANHPVELDATKGRVRLQAWTHRHVAVPLWSAPVKKGSWHSYVLKIREGRSKGTVELWFDGVKQRFANGTTRYTGTTYDGTTNYLKWGSYHPSKGDATHWFTSPRMATTRAAAAGS